MKTGPTSGIDGTAGTPLSYQAIESGKAVSESKLKSKLNPAISDTVETTDRDADGRADLKYPLQSPSKSDQFPTSPQDEPPENGNLLDLTG